MKRFRFSVHEIEHNGDEDNAMHDLRMAGCTDIKVVARHYDCEESITVEATLPEGMAHPRQLEEKGVCV